MSITTRNREDLKDLLKIITVTHKKGKRESGFTRPFDFSELIQSLDYVEIWEGSKHLNSKKLMMWLSKMKQDFLSDEKKFPPSQPQDIIDYLAKGKNFESSIIKKLETQITTNWEAILNSIEVFEIINKMTLNTKIGYLELNQCDDIDAMKIFEIINSEATKLRAVEVLSAGSSWNIALKNPSTECITKVERLYKDMGLPKPDNVVRWDIPATLLERLINLNIIFPKWSYTNAAEFEKKITFGFKIFSGIYLDGVTKDDISKLPEKNPSWESEGLIEDLNTFGRIISEQSFFQFFYSWKKSLLEITSESIALAFLLVSYKDWVRKGKPYGTSTKFKQFLKNNIILFDTLIYEYLTRQWRGSTDSKIASQLEIINSPTTPDVFSPIDSGRWDNLIKEIIDEQKLNGDSLKQFPKTQTPDPLLRPIIYYYYILNNISANPGPDTSFDIDHIYSRSSIESTPSAEFKSKMHNLCNIALLPKKNNISKGDKPLNQITDPWFKKEISRMTDIPEKDFQKYSNLRNFNDLISFRRKKFLDTFKYTRNQILL